MIPPIDMLAAKKIAEDELALTAADLKRLHDDLVTARTELAAMRQSERWRARVIALARQGLKGEKPPKKIFNEIIEACQNETD